MNESSRVALSKDQVMFKPEITNFRYSRHAEERKVERELNEESIVKTITAGKEAVNSDANVYRSLEAKVVCSHDGTIITVSKNNRNANLLMDDKTKSREEHLLSQINNRKNNHALCELGEMYLDGTTGERKVHEAFNLFSRAAKQGNSHAMCKLSEIFELGYLGTPDSEKAEMWLRKAADRGNSYALGVVGQKLLGKYLEAYPVGCNKFRPSAPKREILGYLNKAISKDSTRALWQMGNIWELGLLGEKDLSKAVELYVAAGKKGSPASLDSLHQLTLNGEVECEMLETILDSLTYLTETSIGMAHQLGEDQLRGVLGRNKVRGLNMVEGAALQEYNDAIQLLTLSYRTGIACKEDLRLAQFWYMRLHNLYDKSAKEGNVESLWLLGELKLQGCLGTNFGEAEKNLEKAVEWSRRPEWMYDLGQMYQKGQLVGKPSNYGTELVKKAVEVWTHEVEEGQHFKCPSLCAGLIALNKYKKATSWLSKHTEYDDDNDLVDMLLNIASPERNFEQGFKILGSCKHEDPVVKSRNCTVSDMQWDDELVQFMRNFVDGQRESALEDQRDLVEMLTFRLGTFYKSYDTDYELAAKYFSKLASSDSSTDTAVSSFHELAKMYLSKTLPTKYIGAVTDWALTIPKLLLNPKINQLRFDKLVILLSELRESGGIFGKDNKEDGKWLYLAFYLKSASKEEISKQIESSISKLTDGEKEIVMLELCQLGRNRSTLHRLSRVIGDMFNSGELIPRDVEEALQWYGKASAKNNSIASLAIGRIHHDKGDMEAALTWYKKSARQGDTEALDCLKTIAKDNCIELSDFLAKYEHKSSISESELSNVKPFMNLDNYPKTTKEMLELGKSRLEACDKDGAKFWFLEGSFQGSLECISELIKLYRSIFSGPEAEAFLLYWGKHVVDLSIAILKSEDIPLKQVRMMSQLLRQLALGFKCVDPNIETICRTIELFTVQTQDYDEPYIKLLASTLRLIHEQLTMIVSQSEPIAAQRN